MLGARAWLGRVLLLPRAGAGLAASRRCPGVWPRTWPHRSPSRWALSEGVPMSGFLCLSLTWSSPRPY
ncbi:SPATA20 isoform 26 [Pan troglodytes]|uniref:Spermatogenesis associated 20 n=2 Tax=Homininae TaxID=207598 RepID=D6RIU6_HUMAN|nr:spermatogenesis associated 20 [Homo sapiens]KAI4050484.1 spermatogenesis associated 20 [Homo sapiens]PNI58436.1 SPATA20 isoform 26 [Pan troglodytes]